MDYMISNVIVVNVIIIPIILLIWWQIGWKNWPKVILIIISYPLMDLDHFFLTNVPGFGVQPLPGQKILHVTHTFEFLALILTLFLLYYFLIDPKNNRTFKEWLFPLKIHYSKKNRYYLAWTIRILLLGIIIH